MEKEKLGEGGCGMVYAGYDSLTEKPLAIKIDKRNGQLLRQESDVYKAVRKTFPDARGFPDVYYQGNEKGMELLVMDQLGHSLLDHFGRHGGLSLKTTLMVGLQVLDRLEHMHKSNFLHCDVKPENLVTGLGKDSSTVYMVDMGLARPYRLQDEPFRAEKSNLADGVVGTLMFAPTGLHGSVEVTRRDDLESLGFSLLFLNQGSLPWEFLAYDNENVAEVQRIKRAFWDSEEYRDMPAVLSRVFNIIRSMKHDEEPCYEKFREVLNTALQEMGERNDGVYDWQRAEQIDSLLPSLFTSTMESTFSSVYIRGLESFEGDSFVTISLTDE